MSRFVQISLRGFGWGEKKEKDRSFLLLYSCYLIYEEKGCFR